MDTQAGISASRRGRTKRRLKPLSRLSRRQLIRRRFDDDSTSSDSSDVSVSCEQHEKKDQFPSSSSSRSVPDPSTIGVISSCSGGPSNSSGDVSQEVICSTESAVGEEWLDAEENHCDPCCVACSKCVCLDCDYCIHSSSVCEHFDRCRQGIVYESDLSPEDSDCYSVDNVEDVDDFFMDAESIISEEVETQEQGFVASLVQWVNTFKVPLNAVSALLKILITRIPGLPRDARTLIKTPRATPVLPMLCGTYWHNGLAKGLQHILKISSDVTSPVEVSVNIDGLPLSNSSSSSLWPILGSVLGKVFLVGAYHGVKKPDDFNELVSEFVDEAKILVTEGVAVNGKKVDVYIKKLICDAPATADTIKVANHNAYCGCNKCKVEGIYKNRRIDYPDINAPLRTDIEFRNQTDSDHHRGTSKLLDIPGFEGVTNVLLDYMHLVCLGVMRKLLLLWIKGPLKTRIGNAFITKISDRLCMLSGLKPKEFCRPPRSLKYVQQFKATEFRQLLLYTGPVVFHDCLPPDIYLNFLYLHAVILCSTKFALLNDFLKYANDLLRRFVEDFADIYGEEFVSYNVHNLIHLVEDVRLFGPLDNFSAFPFENYMQYLKCLVRKPGNVLAQLARRIMERESYLPKLSEKKSLFEQHSAGILPRSCVNPQYKRIHLPNFVLDLGDPNNCCGFQDGEVMIIKNFATCSKLKTVVAVGRVFQEKDNLYEKPLPSSCLGILKVKKLIHRLQLLPVDKIVTKYWRIPIGKEGPFAIMPLLHQETSLPVIFLVK